LARLCSALIVGGRGAAGGGIQRPRGPPAVLTGILLTVFFGTVVRSWAGRAGVLLVPELRPVPAEWKTLGELGFPALSGRIDFVAHRVYRGAEYFWRAGPCRFRRRPGKLSTRVARGIQAPESAVARWASGSPASIGKSYAGRHNWRLLLADAAVARVAIRLARWLAGRVLPLPQGGYVRAEASWWLLLAPFGAPGHLCWRAGLYGKPVWSLAG